jgi:hypothetical protein
MSVNVWLAYMYLFSQQGRFLRDKVFVALADGAVRVYSRDCTGLSWNVTSPEVVVLGSTITKMVPIGTASLWCGCLNYIKILNAAKLSVQVCQLHFFYFASSPEGICGSYSLHIMLMHIIVNAPLKHAPGKFINRGLSLCHNWRLCCSVHFCELLELDSLSWSTTRTHAPAEAICSRISS